MNANKKRKRREHEIISCSLQQLAFSFLCYSLVVVLAIRTFVVYAGDKQRLTMALTASCDLSDTCTYPTVKVSFHFFSFLF